MKTLSILLALASTATAAPVNLDFETTTGAFPVGWTKSGTVTQVPGLAATPAAAQLAAAASIHQDFVTAPEIGLATFSMSFAWRLEGSGAVATDTCRLRIRGNNNGGDLITLRMTSAGIQRYSGTWATILPFSATRGTEYSVTVNAANLDADPALEYQVSYAAGATQATSVVQDGWHASTSATMPFETIRFESGTGNTLTVDNIVIPGLPPPPPPPAPDKIVNISGVYPHLAVTNSSNECGIGAIVPWQGDLWAITYAPHSPGGSDDKLYQIAPGLGRVIRPESRGGTPANRFIHTPTNQLIIGPHFIDASKNVRTLSYGSAPGRYTGTAAHLTDPANRIYMFTMEDGLYDVNVNDLSFITRYPDVQGTGDTFLFGYHGKGAYSGNGKLVVANNGRSENQENPEGPTGVLATWDGTVRGAGDPNPERMTAWNEHFRVQTCEVTGPGGIHGNANNGDPVWTTGFDWKSVILRTFENGQWTNWRLPKSSHTHDGSHGWHTEWPRIREISPNKLLMHMHGMFYDFPKTFSAANFSALSPICSYYKMPVDYCTWEGNLVMAKNDASKFSNSLVPRAQSNFWFGQLSDLQRWGSPQGHGSLWREEALNAGQISEPFLIQGFAHGTLHFRNNGINALPLELQISNGNNAWQNYRNVTVPPNSYIFETLENVPAAWLRIVANASSTNATATLLLSNPYPHATPASAATDRYAALADIRDQSGVSDGFIRVMAGTDLKLEFASKKAADTAYHQIGGPMDLEVINDAALESSVRTNAATTKDFGSDAASAWILLGAEKLRLPKLDPLYDSQFTSGWARGFREAVTERVLLNCHGTFYEVPRNNSGGRRKLQPITTHGKRITDFTSWRGMLALTGVLDSAPASDSLLKDASASLWLGEIDDIWRMGEPRGIGGPWLDTAVSVNTPSDAYLMYGYRRKSLALSHQAPAPVKFTVEVDFLANNTWSKYSDFTVPQGETFTHIFPDSFHAHWVRVSSDTAATASAQFTYGPAAVRDRFLDWARDENLPTGAGRAIVAKIDDDQDSNPALLEYILGGDAGTSDPLPLAITPPIFETLIRNDLAADSIQCVLEISSTLETWTPRPDLFLPAPDQSGVRVGFVRMRATVPPSPDPCFFRLRATCP